MALEMFHRTSAAEISVDTAEDLIVFNIPKIHEELTAETYKEVMYAYASAFEMHSFSHTLVDNRYSSFVIAPELQQWTAQEISPKTLCLKRSAMVLNESIFQMVSTKQLIEEAGTDSLVHYFSTPKEAQNWLFENKGGWPY